MSGCGAKAPLVFSVEDNTMADRNYTRAEVIQIIADTARNHGIDKEDFLRAAYIETGGRFDERAYNAGSRAAGLFQFLPGTAEAYGIRGREMDPRLNADAAARLYHDNQRSITGLHALTGRPYLSGEAAPIGLDMYIAHQQGVAGYGSIQTAQATGYFGRNDTRPNVLANISARDALPITGFGLPELRTMPDGDLARRYVDYWRTKYDRIEIPELGIAPRAAGQLSPVREAEHVLRRGSEGEAVARLQRQLVEHGYTREDGSPLRVDGKFGPVTEAAVMRFQARAGLVPDGVVGRDTAAAMHDPALRDGLLRKGERGEAVERLQRRLIDAGITHVHGKPLVADGKFGPLTQAAVEAYQQKHGLPVDGVAGARTLDALAGRAAEKPPAQATRESDQAPGTPSPAPRKLAPGEVAPPREEDRDSIRLGVWAADAHVDPVPYRRAQGGEPGAWPAGAAAAVSPVLLAQQSRVSHAVSHWLVQHGYNAGQIDAITAATAVATVRDGELLSPGTRFHVARDGQRVAAQYASGLLREIDISSALQHTGEQHLHRATQSLVRPGDDPSRGERETGTHAIQGSSERGRLQI